MQPPPKPDGREPLVHIGLHKTGSTWLQEVVFADATLGWSQPWTRNEILERLVLPGPLAFDADATRDAFEEAWSRMAASGGVPVVSHERLSGNPHSGGYDRREIAERIARVLPRARILIVLREQRDAIGSVYRQYVREGGAASLRGYLAPPRQGHARVPMFDYDFFAYDRLVALYRSLFGAERVQVLPFELLRAEPLAFVASLSGFAGARPPLALPRKPHNVGLSAVSVALKRRLNWLLVRDRLNPAGLVGDPRFNTALGLGCEALDRWLPAGWLAWARRRLEQRITRAVGARFRDSNRRTSALVGLDLGAWGYDG